MSFYVADPVKESSTIYDAFVAKEQEKRQEKFVDKLDAREGSGKENADGVQKKKTAVKNGKKPEHDRRKLAFEEAVKEVSRRGPGPSCSNLVMSLIKERLHLQMHFTHKLHFFFFFFIFFFSFFCYYEDLLYCAKAAHILSTKIIAYFYVYKDFFFGG